MLNEVKIRSALVSVFYKEGLEELAGVLKKLDITIFSTGGTYEFLVSKGFRATAIETITGYPSILGGRVKTLHPKIFGGILYRRENPSDLGEMKTYEIPPVDLVIVDLYPFEETVASTKDEEEIIEKIDIGGISLIRAAAKNFRDVVIISSREQYKQLEELLVQKNGITSPEDRRHFAAEAFNMSSHYDTAIFSYFNEKENLPAFKQSIRHAEKLRYGENPHQEGIFYGKLKEVVEQLNGKELSYNNIVDVDAAVQLIREFAEPTVAIIKHTNPCGVASRPLLKQAWTDALAADPVSAFGGIIIVNRPVDKESAEEMNKLFFEVLVAEKFEKEALELLKSKKNRIILQLKPFGFPSRQFKSVLNGVLEQEKDLVSENPEELKYVTKNRPTEAELPDLFYANRIVKHLKSNTIVLVKNKQLIGCGMGQPNRVDALRQAILKARTFGFEPAGSVMASDAFFPFADTVEIAHQAGIMSIIQPGGSIRDEDSVKYCDQHGLSMIFTGIRHFKH